MFLIPGNVAKKTGKNLQTLRDKVLILTLENIFRGGISSVLGDRYKKSDDKKTLYIEAIIYMFWL